MENIQAEIDKQKERLKQLEAEKDALILRVKRPREDDIETIADVDRMEIDEVQPDVFTDNAYNKDLDLDLLEDYANKGPE